MHNVKHCLIPLGAPSDENQGMLDAKELARRLVRAMDDATPLVTSADLARACGVTPQAVNGWRKDGRIAKRHLGKIKTLTGRDILHDVKAGADDEERDEHLQRVHEIARGLPVAAKRDLIAFAEYLRWRDAPKKSAKKDKVTTGEKKGEPHRA